MRLRFRKAVLPVQAGRSVQQIGRARRQGHIDPLEPLARPLPEPHHGRRQERDAHHLLEHRPVPVPADGRTLAVDVILWCTGFRSSLDHLMPLMLREPGGGIVMGGRLATKVEKDPRIHLVGYGPSASTIGANRAGRAAAKELTDYLGMG